MSNARQTRKKGSNPLAVLANAGTDNCKTGTVMPPAKVIATDRKIPFGSVRGSDIRKISFAADRPQNRWEWETI